ncbi:BZ3500_MvSof-1268-A1-R1_Chr8-1g10019 [Microbotryum saponariae]|uniref:BZ3500_MvSof-1268-A1-R1_Chr8-1g10019 protein n=1 Tax=Microbotryum saponariae TaxID=289078 RepID=A0A2X0LB11_9BASI|nr:BZ3500_MvSof-1268-A1-R1_Chr8-1g10019 [Microbotryum saponariae]SDA08305.1 BZ3501_MvSof-1269-A2-R1_Chr8-1g09742 [Microbotryum saponariae]
MYEVEPLQEYELVSQLRVPGWEQNPALWPAPIPEADEEQPIDHRREVAIEAIDSYEDDDPVERAPPLPPDDGHEYRHYRVGRNPGLLENIDEGNILPVRTRAQRRVAAISIVCTCKIVRREPELIASFSTRHPPLPKTFKDAMASPEAESWDAASVKEVNSMGLHKEDAEGNIISYKARLVVQSFAPRLGIDYHKTFAPVSSITTILFVVGLSAARGLILEQWS